jgi:hypothetical protein
MNYPFYLNEIPMVGHQYIKLMERLYYTEYLTEEDIIASKRPIISIYENDGHNTRTKKKCIFTLDDKYSITCTYNDYAGYTLIICYKDSINQKRTYMYWVLSKAKKVHLMYSEEHIYNAVKVDFDIERYYDFNNKILYESMKALYASLEKNTMVKEFDYV